MEFIDVREKLFDNAVAVADRDGYIQEVDLTVVPWNRATVADGQWLNDHAIAPLSCRDLFLADCIQSAFDGIASVEYTLSSYGMGGDGSGASGKKGLPASNVLPLNNIVDDNDNWNGHYANVVPGPYDLITPSSTMVTFNIRGKSHNIGGLPEGYFSDSISNPNAILQFNGAVGAANQLLFTTAGLFARTYSVAKEAIQTDPFGAKNVHYAGTDTPFAKIPLFTGLDADTPASGKLLTYDYANNTFGLADYTLPPEATAITGTTGAHLTTASNCVKLNDAGLTSGKEYFITTEGFEPYSVPDFPTGVSGIAALSSDDGKISAYGLALGDSLQNGDFVFVKVDTSISAKNITLPPFSGVDDVFTTADNKLGLQTGSGIDITSGKLAAKCQGVISVASGGIKLNYTNYLTANGDNLDVAIDSVASYVLNTYKATYGESRTASSIKQVLEDLIGKVNSLIPEEQPEEQTSEG